MVAVGVVDLLEAVEVEHEEGERGVLAAAAFERGGESVFKGSAVGQAGELVVVGEPAVAGDLLLEHNENHADGDEGLLHVPNVGGDVGVGAIGDDEGVKEEEEGPDDKSGEDGEAAGAAARQAAVEVDGGDGVDGPEIPVDGFAIFAA